jgi:uncharacterized protein (DUF4415 family)
VLLNISQDLSVARPSEVHTKHLKKQVTLRLDIDVIDYFKKLAEETGVPYQNLINLYLQDCAHSQKKLRLKWAS